MYTRLLVILLVVLSLFTIISCRNDKKTEQNTSSGLDVLVMSNFDILKGKQVGVITNHTGIDRNGKHIADLLNQSNQAFLKALFSPEHGIRGQIERGATITTAVDTKTGVPVYSLYGETRKPKPDMLRDLDILVFDIQDIGTRFYTFISTMSLAMEAAAENEIPFIVLDRPNPVSGAIVEGPVLNNEFISFIGMHPIPLRHGLTVGELAQLINGEGFLKDGIQVNLTVVPMRNWRRNMFFEQTGLSWVGTSPNMQSINAALLYPGMGLLEATNISEGRGTMLPFEMVGAPWIDNYELLKMLDSYHLSGIEYDTTTFVPTEIPGASMNPKYKGQRCNGLLLHPTNPTEFRSLEFGIYYLSSIRALYPEYLEMQQSTMNRMTGIANVYDALMQNMVPESIISTWEPELEKFLKIREEYLLYE